MGGYLNYATYATQGSCVITQCTQRT